MERRLRRSVALQPPLQVLQALAERGHEAAAVHGVGVVEHHVQLNHHRFWGCAQSRALFMAAEWLFYFGFFFWKGHIISAPAKKSETPLHGRAQSR